MFAVGGMMDIMKSTSQREFVMFRTFKMRLLL